MPIYEYRCENCNYQSEKLESIHAPCHSDCPKCQQSSFKRIISMTHFQLKGNGWYVTDFKNNPKNSPSTTTNPSHPAAQKNEHHTQKTAQNDASTISSTANKKNNSSSNSKGVNSVDATNAKDQ